MSPGGGGGGGGTVLPKKDTVPSRKVLDFMMNDFSLSSLGENKVNII